MHQPKLLIFDEPFSGFDPINANVIKDEILQLRDEGATVIFSTHRMESVEAMCDHIALINESKKILDGKLVDIKRTHKTNSFEVGLVSKNKSALKRLISQYYDIDTANFKSIEDDLKLNIHLSLEQSSDDLLSFLSQNSSVKHFKELIPSVDDIFIKTVKNN
jgi:ABC-2 type transport system ATP-binding protein